MMLSTGCVHMPKNQLFIEDIPNASVSIHILQTGDSRTYLIENKNGLIMVDAGWPGNADKILEAMERIGRKDLRLIFITHAHFDHYGSAAEVHRVTGAPIAIHKADAEAMANGKTPIRLVRGLGVLGKLLLPMVEMVWRPEATDADILFEDGYSFKKFGLDGTVLHTPGHTPGSSCLIVHGKYFFVGDLIVNRPWPAPQRYYAHNWMQISESVNRVLTYDPLWVFPGHGKPVAREKLKRLSSQ